MSVSVLEGRGAMLACAELAAEMQQGEIVRSGAPSVRHDTKVAAGSEYRPPLYCLVKILADWLIAFALVVLTAPLMLVLAVLVKLTSDGPIFYAQTRLGLGGVPYRLIKFRTMVHGAEAGTGPVWAAKNDRRITRIGRILRDTHLDELPQLWNVLRGEMSLIGPRPERPELAVRIERHVPEFRRRLQIRPGITGLAQMLVPADDPDDHHFEGTRRKLSCDLFYVQRVSLPLDVKIAVCTTCYFVVRTIDSVRLSIVRSYRDALEIGMSDGEVIGQTDCDRAA